MGTISHEEPSSHQSNSGKPLLFNARITADKDEASSELIKQTSEPEASPASPGKPDGGDSDSDTSLLDPATRCGFWLFQPPVLQGCARVECFTGFYSLSALITSTLSMYVNSQITTLERQFGFSSTQTGLIMAANDIGFLMCVLFLSYSAANFHIPRALGVTTAIFGISGIACCMPFFLFRSSIDAMVDSFTNTGSENATSQALEAAGPAKPAGIFGDVCLLNRTGENQSDIEEVSSAQSPPPITPLPGYVVTASLGIIFVGMMLQGIGKSPRMSFSVTYVDDNSRKTDTGFYMGIITTFSILGPFFAFTLGGIFSGIFVTLEETTLTPKHPRWIGAWWLGYIVCGAMALLVALPLMWFPRRLPPRKRHDKDDNPGDDEEKQDALFSLVSDAKSQTKEEKDEKEEAESSGHTLFFYLRHIKSFTVAVLRLLTNPVLMAMIASSCFDIFAFSGTSAYNPKYLERIFDLPAHTANYITGGKVLFAGCLGTFLGGYFSRRLKLTAKPALLFTIIVDFISMLGVISCFIWYCEQPEIHNWPGSPESCSEGCNCEDNSFFAVCGSDGKTYYSPCTAGCGQIVDDVYTNCTCIPDVGQAVGGMCSYGCGQIYPYVAAMGVRSLFGTIKLVPKLVVFIRCVAQKDRGLGIGLYAFLTALLGWLLGPLIFGNFIDGICTIWDITSTGVRGRCLLYDNDVFRVRLYSYNTGALVISLSLLLFAYIYAHCTGSLDEPGKGETKEDENKK